MGLTMAGVWQSIKRRGWLVVKLVALAAVVGGIVYWLKFAPVSVSVHQAERGEIVAEVMGTGTVGDPIRLTKHGGGTGNQGTL